MDNQEKKERNMSRKVVVLGDVAVGKTSIIQR
jgi:GTPase SAR1 family protein